MITTPGNITETNFRNIINVAQVIVAVVIMKYSEITIRAGCGFIQVNTFLFVRIYEEKWLPVFVSLTIFSGDFMRRY